MHQLVASFFALLLSLCHHTAVTRPVEAAEINTIETPRAVMVLPDRYQLARSINEASYSETTCVSCRRTDNSSSDR